MELVKKKTKDHLITIRTHRDLVKKAKILNINISETLHKTLVRVVEEEFKKFMGDKCKQ